MTKEEHTGVWLSDIPLDSNEGPDGDTLLAVELPTEIVEPYEWKEEGKTYREFLVPSALINPVAQLRILEDDKDEGREWNPLDSR